MSEQKVKEQIIVLTAASYVFIHPGVGTNTDGGLHECGWSTLDLTLDQSCGVSCKNTWSVVETKPESEGRHLILQGG